MTKIKKVLCPYCKERYMRLRTLEGRSENSKKLWICPKGCTQVYPMGYFERFSGLDKFVVRTERDISKVEKLKK